MKALLFGKTLVIITSKGLSRAQSRGLATLEILIAFAVLSLTLTAMVAVAFSNQSISVDTQNNSEALALARAQLEDARAAARADFYSLLPLSGTHPSGALTYGTSVAYSDIAPFAKQATSTITWITGDRTLSTVLSTILTDPLGSLSGDTCSPTSVGDWTAPIGPQNGPNPGYGYYEYPNPDGTTGVDIAGGRAYVTTDPSSALKQDFYVIGVNDPKAPGDVLPLLGMFNTTYGLTDVRVSGNYAYVTADSALYQLIILNKADPHNMFIVGKKRVTPIGDSAIGNSVFYDYKTRRVYIGTTLSSGKEFHVIDISDPTAPVEMGTGFEVGARVNQILVDGTIVYLATASASQVIKLDVSDPNTIQLRATFPDDSSGLLSGQSLLLSGNTLYFGRSGGGSNAYLHPQLFALNASDLSQIWSLTTAPVHKYNSVNRMVLREELLFVAAGSHDGGFEIWDVSDTPPSRHDTSPLTISEGTTAGFDCEGNYVFIGGASNRALQIVGPSLP